jgi:hypothetical protein
MMLNKEPTMDKKQFNEHLTKLFGIKESNGEVTGLVAPGENSIDTFRNGISCRLKGLRKSPEGQPPVQVGPGKPGEAIMEQPVLVRERNNPISVATIKDQVVNFGPKGVSQIVNKLSPDMTKTNSEGQPTSDFNMFIDSIKQEGLELLIKYGADAGGVKVPPGGSAASPEAGGTPEDPNKEEPGQELASL